MPSTPVVFIGANEIHRAPPGMENCVDIAVHNTGDEIIACVKLDPEDIAHIVRTGQVWISFASRSLMPFRIQGEPLMRAVGPVSGAELIYRTDGLHLVPEAMDYAVELHGDQPYGPYTHAYHLGQVVDYLSELDADWAYLCSGWLHDTVEDTELDLTPEDRRQKIATRFGDFVAALVWAVSGIKIIDGVKQNRKACNEQIYGKIDQFPPAAILKGGDRWANMKACLDFDDLSKATMYAKEHAEFITRVGPHLPGRIIADLDRKFDQLLEAFPSLVQYKES